MLKIDTKTARKLFKSVEEHMKKKHHVPGRENSVLERCQFSPINLQFPCDLDQHPNGTFYGTRRAESQVYLKEKICNSQENFAKEP